MTTNASDNNHPIGVQLVGGVTQLQFGVPDAPAVTNAEPLRDGVSDGGAHRLTSDGKYESFGGVTRHQVDRSVDPSLGILASARSANGSRSAPITGASVVTIPGGIGDVSIGAAVNLGFLRRTASGDYVETTQSAPTFVASVNAPTLVQQQAQSASLPLLPETEVAIERVASSLPYTMRDSFINKVVTAGPEAAVATFAAHSTMDVATLTQDTNDIAVSFGAHLSHTLNPHGIDAQQFSEWATKHAPGEFRQAKSLHAHSRSTAGYASLVAAFLSRTVAPEVMEGRQTRTARDGTVEVMTEIGWTSMKAAKRGGLI